MSSLLTAFRRWLETSTRKQKWTVVFTAVGLLCTVALLSMNGGSGTSRDALGSTPLYFAGALVKLIVVLLLIVASALFARRWLQPALAGKTVRQMRLVESVRLSPKQALHLVSVGDQQFLIGATDQNVALIAQMDGSFDPAPVKQTNTQPALDFGSVLQSINTGLSR
jgi:flagellar biosynthetic protein FliO